MCTKIELIDWLLYELFTYQILSKFHNKLWVVLLKDLSKMLKEQWIHIFYFKLKGNTEIFFITFLIIDKEFVLRFL